ncbi:MAG: hypothetical protein J6T45_07305 [Fibrobacterales bacterium]|nr:hypothetical protein [Fibrobacterales bacterium]
MHTIRTAIDLIRDQRDNLKKIIDVGCPYEAFQLLALHIDFLGKLLHRLKPDVSTAWANDEPNARTCFENLVQLPSMQKYDKDVLRDNLRNGMIHNEAPKAHLWLTHTACQELSTADVVINIYNIYDDYSSACDEIIKRLEEYEKAYPNSLMKDKKFPRIVIKQMP